LTGDSKDKERQYRIAVFRLLRTAIPVVLVTKWALLEGVAHRNSAEALSAISTAKNEAGNTQPQAGANSTGGYESVILWPYRAKRQIIPPVVLQKELLAPGTMHPLMIRFTGPYWFVQPPHSTPGPGAHRAHGTPRGVGIASINQIPLVMQAHQYLSAPIHTARCQEIEVEIENSDNKAGATSLARLNRHQCLRS
jgi:hypothetical protein